MLNLSQRQTFVTRNLLISSMVIASFTHRTLKESDNSCGLSLSLSLIIIRVHLTRLGNLIIYHTFIMLNNISKNVATR